MVEVDKILTKNEELVLYGLVKFPYSTDKDIAEKLDIPESTFTTIKNRLAEKELFKPYVVPMLNKVVGGCELLGIIFLNFNLIIDLEKRKYQSKGTIESSKEMFLSIGEPEKGFSMSLSKNYTNFAKINENRIETFGRMGLLENETPHEIIFPLEISEIKNFFNYSRLLSNNFNIDYQFEIIEEGNWFQNSPLITLTDNEVSVLKELVTNPDATMSQIGEKTGLTRQSVAKIKKELYEEKKLLKRMVIPEIQALGFKMLAFYRFKFGPEKVPRDKDIEFLNSPSTIFLAKKRFELVILSAYWDYNAYKEDKMSKIKYLKENNITNLDPLVRKFEYERTEYFKEYEFLPITTKIFGNEGT